MISGSSSVDVFARVFEAAGTMLCVLDAQGRIVKFNIRAEQSLFGQACKGTGPDFLEACVAGPDRARVLGFLLTAMSGQSVHNVTVLVSRNAVDESGRARVLVASFTPLRAADQSVDGVVFSAQDLMAPLFHSVRAGTGPLHGAVPSTLLPECHAENDQTLTQQAVPSILSGRMILDEAGAPTDFVVLDANGEFEATFGLRLEDFRGRRVSEVLPDTRKTPIIPILGRVVATGIPVTYAHESHRSGRSHLISAYRVADLCFIAVLSDNSPRGRTPAVAPGPGPEIRYYAAEPARPRSGIPNRFEGIGARVLLAEDNLTNQQVALLILRKLGLAADVVSTGHDVLRSLHNTHYDLVLMDVQMPDMDGIEATRAIRSGREYGLNSRIPIIAMTAQDMESDRMECLLAGMNDYIAKPVTAEALSILIEKWLKASAGIVIPCEPSVKPQRAATPVFNRAELLERLMDDLDLARDVTNGFVEDMPKQLRALRAKLDAHDAVACGRQAHTIKGAASAVAGERMAELAFLLEKAGAASDLATVASHIEQLEREFASLASAIGTSLVPSSDGARIP